MADPGKQYLIIDITIENIGKDKNLSYSGDQFIILDSDEVIEISYGEDVSSLELEKHFNGDNISPGEKRQGELSFQVPEGAKGLLLKFEYSPESSGGSRSEFFMLDQWNQWIFIIYSLDKDIIDNINGEWNIDNKILYQQQNSQVWGELLNR